MRKIFYLKSCSTCIRILKEWNAPESVSLQNIKSEPLTENQIEELKSLAGSYEALFSRRSTLYKTLNLKEKNLTETDYKHYLLDHYTFLKRPVLVLDDKIFIGNQKEVVAEAKKALHE